MENTNKEKLKMTGEQEDRFIKVDYNSEKKKKTQLKWSKCVLILILLNVVLILSLLTLVVWWRAVRQANMTPREQTICISCKAMGYDDKEFPEHLQGMISKTFKEGSNETVCCGNASDVLNQLISKAIKERGTVYRSSISELASPECRKTPRVLPSAQVSGISFQEMEKGEHRIIHWNLTEHSFFKGGISYRNGRLSTKQPGYYYIFSQIKYRHNSPIHSEPDVTKDASFNNDFQTDTPISHYIYRYSIEDGSTQKILESSKSQCEMSSVADETTSSMGAVFYLAEQDELFVNTSHPHNLMPCSVGNYFGIYLT